MHLENNLLGRANLSLSIGQNGSSFIIEEWWSKTHLECPKAVP